MKYTHIVLVSLALAFSVNAATYYVDYTAGSDGNNGTSKATPWKRAPGMKGFGGSYGHAAGDRFIFKGGVTWPVGCFQMKITRGGSSGALRDYYGSDPTWYAGGTFAKPLFDFQHTLVGPGWTAAAGVLVEGCSYITFDGIELANHRTPLQINGVITWGSSVICLSTCSGFILKNCVIRDWDSPTPILYGTSGGGGIIRVNSGSDNLVTHSVFHQQGVAVKSGTSIWNINEVAYSEIHHTATAVMSAQSVHHNHIHHLMDPTDAGAHSNVMLCNGGLRAFNNLIHDVSPTAQVIFVAPGYYGTAAQDWIYNNVIYNIAQPCIAIDTDGQNSLTSGTHVFNNTLVGAYGTGHCIRVGHRSNGNLALLEVRNNHYITASAPILKDNIPFGGGYVTTFLDGPNVTHTPAQATALGYTAGNAYQPIDSSKPTVNVGVNLSGHFTTDIKGVLRGQLGAWDAGAYEFGTGASVGTPGTLSLDAATRTVNETAGSMTMTVRRTGGSAGAVACAFTTVNGSATAGVNFTAASGTLSWANGDAASKTITVTILNKSTIGTKDFRINLSNATDGATFGSPSSALITISGSGAVSPTNPEPSFTNGSFESGITGWVASGNYGIAGSIYKASDGAQVAVFNWGQSTPNGSLSQTFGTVAGQTYGLSFDAGVLAFNYSEQRMQVTARGANEVLSKTVSVLGNASGASKWGARQSFTFVADGSATTVSFKDVSTTTLNVDLLLDNVQVTASAPTTPTTPPPASSLSITSQPSSLTAATGSTAEFNVTAVGTGTFTYQWRFNGSAISGATGSSYTIANVQSGHAGSYTVAVSNGSTSVVSAAATLTVTQSPTTPSPEPSFTNGSFESGITGWSASGNYGIAGSYYKASDGTQLAVFNWGQSTPNGSLSQTFSTVAGQTYGLSFDAGVLAFNYSEQRMQVTARGAGVVLSKTVSVFGNSSGASKWGARQSFTFTADSSATTVIFKDVSTTTLNVDLLLDNVQVTTSAPTPPTTTPPESSLSITSQPSSLTAATGSSAAFNVTAAGTGTFTYQWRFNGNAISGATGSSYTIASVQSGNGGSYTVAVSNGSTSVVSAAATLTVTISPATPNPGPVLANGSFESGYTGWTQSGYQQIAQTSRYTGGDGAYLVAFNGGDMPANGILSQSLPTTAGQEYVLTCNVGVLAFNWNEQRMLVTVQGTGTLLSKTMSVFGAGGGSTRWTPQSFTFVADSATTKLTFRDVSPTTKALDLLLDKVNVAPGN